MNITRADKTNNFSVICNFHLRDNRLSLSARGLFTYILSLPDDWNFTPSGIASNIGLSDSMTKKYLRELYDNGYIVRVQSRNGSSGKFLQPEYFIYEIPQSQKPQHGKTATRLTAQRKTAERETAERETDDTADRIAEKVPLLNTNTIQNTNSSSTDIQSTNIDYDDIVKLFNQICLSLPQIMKLTDKRRKALKKANCDDWESLFRRVEASDFLTGRNGTWNGCSFDWIIKPDNMVKILEGNYDNKFNQQKSNYENYTNEIGEWLNDRRNDS